MVYPYLSRCWNLVVHFVITLLFVCLVVFISPVFIYRAVVSLAAKYVRPDLGHMLSPQSSLYLPSTQPTFNVLIHFKVKGRLSYKAVVNQIVDKCIWLKENGIYVYPELQKSYATWLGYTFWKDEIDVDVDAHFHYLKLNSREELEERKSEIIKTAFSANLSPWEILFFEIEDEPNEYEICFKFHHSLCDGYSIFSALIQIADSPVSQLNHKFEKGSFWSQIKLAYESVLSFSRVTYGIATHNKEAQSSSPRLDEHLVSISDVIQLGRIKAISRQFKVSVSTIIVTLFAGALRKRLLENGQIPTDKPCIIPIFFPRNKKQFTNEIRFLEFSLPLGDPSLLGRMNSIEASFQLEKKQNTNGVYYCLDVLIGLLPLTLRPGLIYPTHSISIFPGPTKAFFLGGNKVEDIAYVMNASKLLEIEVNIMSYDGKIRYWTSADRSIMPDQKRIDQFSAFICEELRELEILSSKSFKSKSA